MSGLDGHVKLLLHCDGDDASTAFTDSSFSPHTVTANGDAQIDTAQSVFGGASALFDGTGDELEIPDSDDWDLWNGDATIDFWVRFNDLSSGADKDLIAQIDEVNDLLWLIWLDKSGEVWRIRFHAGTTLEFAFTDRLAEVAIESGVWYHFAVELHGSNMNFYQDGMKLTTVGGDVTFPVVVDLAHPLKISPTHFGTPLDGWLDEIRISKGIARYRGENFTPPTAAYSFSDFPDRYWRDLERPPPPPKSVDTYNQQAYIDTLRAIIRRRISLGASHQGTVQLHGRHKPDQAIDVEVKS